MMSGSPNKDAMVQHSADADIAKSVRVSTSGDELNRGSAVSIAIPNSDSNDMLENSQLLSKKNLHAADPPIVSASVPESYNIAFRVAGNKISIGLGKSEIAVILAVLSSFFFATMNLCVKEIAISGQPLPVFQIVCIRSASVVLLCLIATHTMKVPHPILGPPEIRRWLVLRGCVGFTALSMSWYSFNFLPLGEATVLGFLSPTFTGILGRLLLKEPWELMDAIAGFFSLIGVTFIARPAAIFGSDNPAAPPVDSQNHLIGVVCCIASALLGSCVFLIIRKIGTRAHAFHALLYFSYIGTTMSVVASLVSGQIHQWQVPRTPVIWVYLGGASVMGFGGQFMFTKALQMEKAAKVSTVNYMQVLFAYMLEMTFLGVYPNAFSITGAIIVGVSLTTLAVIKLRRSQKLQASAH